MNKYYYLGEFGFFNLEVLGKLEKYFLKNQKEKINLLTYENYADVLKAVFPNHFNFVCIKWLSDNKNGVRSSHEYVSHKKEIMHLKKGRKNLINLYDPKKKFNVLEPAYLSTNLEIKKEKNKEFISIFPRNRAHYKNKNLPYSFWNKLLLFLIKEFPKKKIIVHGAGKEFLKLKEGNVLYAKRAKDQIYYLNNSIFSICPDSGFAHFSLNCGCDTFVIGKGYQYFSFFNPFKNKLKIVDSNKFKYGQLKEFYITKFDLLNKFKLFFVSNYFHFWVKAKSLIKKHLFG